jgi:hypothetical protein
MRISGSGNVGIGTTSPAYKLDVRGAYVETGIISIRSTDSAAINVGGVLGFGGFHNASANESQWAWIKGAKENSNGNNNASYLSFATMVSGASPTEKMRITSVGNVGIGTTTSNWGTPFNVIQGGSYGQYVGFQTNVPDMKIGVNHYYNSGYIYTTTDKAAQFNISSESGFQFNLAPSGTAGNAVTFTAAMVITSAGNVGIGTSSPLTRFDCQTSATGTVTETAAFRDSSTNGNALQIFNGNNEARIRAVYYGTPSDQNITFWTITSGGSQGERMRITSGGDILFGKTTTALTTNGVLINNTTNSQGQIFSSIPVNQNTYHVWDTTNGVYRFYVSGGGTINATNTTISAISDVRLKENITDLEIGLDAIMALRPRKFDWRKESGNDGKNVRGFIAQEFEQVFPDLIDESLNKSPEGEPYKQIRQDLIPVLVKAIQELKAEIDELKNK